MEQEFFHSRYWQMADSKWLMVDGYSLYAIRYLLSAILTLTTST
jgi:hypothetical protein